MEGFPTTAETPVRFRDTDALGHVNNAVYLSYLETARFQYCREAFDVTDWRRVGFIVARVEIDYRSPAHMGDTLVVGVKVTRLGGASFTMDYRVEDKATGRLVAEAKSVQVAYDYESSKVRKLTPEFIETVRRRDGVA